MQEKESLNWHDLVMSARSTSCMDVHLRLCALPRDEALKWTEIEPILGLHANHTDKTDSPLLPVATVRGLDKDLLLRLVEKVDEIPSTDIAARILDLAWSSRIDSGRFALPTIEKYLLAAQEYFDLDNWLDTYFRYARAMKIAVSAGRKYRMYERVVTAIEQAIADAQENDSRYLTLRLIRLLLSNKLGDPVKLAALCHTLAGKARASYEREPGNSIQHEREKGFIELEIDWINIRPPNERDGDKVKQLRLSIAESLVRHAEGVIKAGWQSAKLIASTFLEDAITELRKTGGQQERTKELRLRQMTLQREAVKEMPTFTVRVDVSAQAESATNHVTRKDPLDSIFSLAMMHRVPSLANLRKIKHDLDETYVSRKLLPPLHLSPRGTTLAKHVKENPRKDEDSDDRGRLDPGVA
jgi:hypothetical protein